MRNYSNARPRRSHTITRLLENNTYCYNDTINYDSFNAFFFEGVGFFIFILIYNRFQARKALWEIYFSSLSPHPSLNNVIFAMSKSYVWSGAFHGIMTSFGIFYKNLKLDPFVPLILSMLTCKSRIVPEINSCSLNPSFEFSAVDVKEKSKQLKWCHKQLLEEEPLPG